MEKIRWSLKQRLRLGFIKPHDKALGNCKSQFDFLRKSSAMICWFLDFSSQWSRRDQTADSCLIQFSFHFIDLISFIWFHLKRLVAWRMVIVAWESVNPPNTPERALYVAFRQILPPAPTKKQIHVKWKKSRSAKIFLGPLSWFSSNWLFHKAQTHCLHILHSCGLERTFARS